MILCTIIITVYCSSTSALLICVFLLLPSNHDQCISWHLPSQKCKLSIRRRRSFFITSWPTPSVYISSFSSFSTAASSQVSMLWLSLYDCSPRPLAQLWLCLISHIINIWTRSNAKVSVPIFDKFFFRDGRCFFAGLAAAVVCFISFIFFSIFSLFLESCILSMSELILRYSLGGYYSKCVWRAGFYTSFNGWSEFPALFWLEWCTCSSLNMWILTTQES